jgi:hypothetical protein
MEENGAIRHSSAAVNSHVSVNKDQHGVDHAAPEIEHAWIFQFVDIVYVATIYNISHLIELCGPSTYVYVVCFAYFVIMFSSRLAFDEYICISRAKGILHLIAFCAYGAGVFVMTVNIYAKPTEDEAHSSSGATEHHENNSHSDYGTCQRSDKYDIGFAAAFIFTRFVLVVMYILYFYVFHQSNRLEHIVNEDVQMSTMSSSTDNRPSEDGTENPINMARKQSGTLAVEGLRGYYGEDRGTIVEQHFSSIVTVKILPAVLSSLVMLGMFFKTSPAIILPIVAAIEFCGGFLPSLTITDPEKWRKLSLHRHFALERLGLYFMLVLGEAVLGLAVRRPDTDDVDFFSIYTVLL